MMHFPYNQSVFFFFFCFFFLHVSDRSRPSTPIGQVSEFVDRQKLTLQRGKMVDRLLGRYKALFFCFYVVVVFCFVFFVCLFFFVVFFFKLLQFSSNYFKDIFA